MLNELQQSIEHVQTMEGFPIGDGIVLGLSGVAIVRVLSSLRSGVSRADRKILKQDLDYLHTVILPAEQEAVREYEQRILAQRQRKSEEGQE